MTDLECRLTRLERRRRLVPVAGVAMIPIGWQCCWLARYQTSDYFDFDDEKRWFVVFVLGVVLMSGGAALIASRWFLREKA